MLPGETKHLSALKLVIFSKISEKCPKSTMANSTHSEIEGLIHGLREYSHP